MTGRLPKSSREIALGARTLRQLHGRIGATIRVSMPLFSTRARPMTVVGTTVLPTMSDALGLGTGAALTPGGMHYLLPAKFTIPPPSVFVRFRPGVEPLAGRKDLATRLARAGSYTVNGPATPTDLLNFGQVQDLPQVLGIGLAVVALLTIAHLLMTSVRRRRRDFAILRALGFTSWQVRGTLCWQALTLAGIALLIGVPAGIACGRLCWQVFAHQLGITPVVAVPLAVLAVMAAGAGRRRGDRRPAGRGGHAEPPGPGAAQRIARPHGALSLRSSASCPSQPSRSPRSSLPFPAHWRWRTSSQRPRPGSGAHAARHRPQDRVRRGEPTAQHERGTGAQNALTSSRIRRRSAMQRPEQPRTDHSDLCGCRSPWNSTLRPRRTAARRAFSLAFGITQCDGVCRRGPMRRVVVSQWGIAPCARLSIVYGIRRGVRHRRLCAPGRGPGGWGDDRRPCLRRRSRLSAGPLRAFSRHPRGGSDCQRVAARPHAHPSRVPGPQPGDRCAQPRHRRGGGGAAQRRSEHRPPRARPGSAAHGGARTGDFDAVGRLSRDHP